MSKTHCFRKCLFALILMLTFAAPAFAAPVVFTIVTDEPLNFKLEITGGPIDQLFQLTLKTEQTPNQFWEYSVAIAEASNPPFDSVIALVTVTHLINPPGHEDLGAGLPINFPIFVFAINAVGGKVERTVNFSVIHGQHSDVLEAVLSADVDANFHITAWTLTIDTIHTPEPATMLLLGTGLAGVAMKMRKKFKVCRSGQGAAPIT